MKKECSFAIGFKSLEAVVLMKKNVQFFIKEREYTCSFFRAAERGKF